MATFRFAPSVLQLAVNCWSVNPSWDWHRPGSSAILYGWSLSPAETVQPHSEEPPTTLTTPSQGAAAVVPPDRQAGGSGNSESDPLSVPVPAVDPSSSPTSLTGPPAEPKTNDPPVETVQLHNEAPLTTTQGAAAVVSLAKRKAGGSGNSESDLRPVKRQRITKCPDDAPRRRSARGKENLPTVIQPAQDSTDRVIRRGRGWVEYEDWSTSARTDLIVNRIHRPPRELIDGLLLMSNV
ncbi:hypothetical protein GGX14DRAFT_384037 [Mycena pura]|uniref:Uncharacterized protein n=1 Tax=Mycena pura TaxID=153505 RepID=A0AAD6YUK4_9AGAR|nr:hypothetical protein GGX14DRAFT_384037 [Mycena pura]